MGMLLSVPLMLAGFAFIVGRACKRPPLRGLSVMATDAARSRNPPAHRAGRADAGAAIHGAVPHPSASTATTSTRDPLGRGGDFITAPEISQMFGELIGLWAASAWHQMGQPENVRLVELGPGRGTMMLDALRAAQVVPAFRAAIVLHLVEISPALQQRQQQALATLDVPVMWHQIVRRGAGRPGHRPRQRVLRRAAGATRRSSSSTAGTSAWSRSTATAISRSASPTS